MTEIPPIEPATEEPSKTTTTLPNSCSTKVDILVLGAGWLSQFLLPLLRTSNISYAATTTTGRDNTIPFKFIPDDSSDDDDDNNNNNDLDAYRRLPYATSILITFPFPTADSPRVFVQRYQLTHQHGNSPQYILLGSTGAFPTTPGWHTRHSTVPTGTNPPSTRWQAETTLLNLNPSGHSCVLHLAGLYGEPVRDGRIWDRAVPKTKQGLRAKKSVHFIHGADVSKGVVAVWRKFIELQQCHDKMNKEAREAKTQYYLKHELLSHQLQHPTRPPPGQRWILTDMRVYDWWDLVWWNARYLDDAASASASVPGDPPASSIDHEYNYRKWIAECMQDDNVRALPRDGDLLGRRLDSREFWHVFGIVPVEAGFAWSVR